MLTARREKLLSKLAGEVQSKGGQASIIPCDLSDRNSRNDLINKLLSNQTIPDILINNAGYGNYRLFIKELPDEIARIMEVNYNAAAHLMSALLPSMVERGSGAIVNVSSGAGRIALPFMASYCATKFALCALTEAVSYELKGSGVTIHLVNPGPVDTEFFDAGIWEGQRPNKKASASQVSNVIQKAILRNRPVSYVPPKRGLLIYAFNILGPIGRWVMRRKFENSKSSTQIES